MKITPSYAQAEYGKMCDILVLVSGEFKNLLIVQNCTALI